MNLKKSLAIIAVAALMLSMTACSGKTSEKTGSAAAPDAAKVESAAAPDAAKIASVEDLTGKKIGVQQGTTGDIYAEDIEDATIERFNKGADAVMALKQGKIDAVIIDDQPAKVFAAQNSDIAVLPEAFTVEDYAICVSKEKAELTAEMNKAISELKSDGTLQNILDYYVGQVEGSAPYECPADADHSNGTLKMATNAAFPPYEFWENEKISGIDADFARAICDKMGYELEIVDMDFDSIITAVQSGKADFGAAGMTVTEDRLKSIDFTESYCTGTQVVIVKK